MERVKLIFRKKMAVLVEYLQDGVPVRVSVPSNRVFQITDNKKEVEVSEKTLREGIPYGIPWAIHVKDVTIKGEDLERELHKAGIWTLDDYKRNPGAIQSAIMSLAVSVLRSVVQTVKEYSSKEVTK